MDLPCSLFKNPSNILWWSKTTNSLTWQDGYFLHKQGDKVLQVCKMWGNMRRLDEVTNSLAMLVFEQGAPSSSQSTLVSGGGQASVLEFSVSAAKQGCWVIGARLSRGVCIPVLIVQVHFFKTPNKFWSWDKCNSCNSIGRNLDSHLQPSAQQKGFALR